MKCILDHVFTPWLESKSPFVDLFGLSTLGLEGLQSTTWGEFVIVIVCGSTLGSNVISPMSLTTIFGSGLMRGSI
jgi:hypothetical protein